MMKTIYKNLFNIASGTVLCLFLAFSASAQRPSGGGSSGSSSKPSGGGGGSSSSSSARPSGGGSVSVSRPPSGSSFQRPSGGGGGIQRANGQVGYANRQSGVARGNYGYAPRQGTAVRGNYGFAPRQDIAIRGNGYPSRAALAPGRTARNDNGVVAYRTSPQIGYGHGGYWGNHNYTHYAHGYYNSYYLPRLGFRCAVLPYGYYPFFWGDYQYYYSDGLYYQYDNNEYTVVEPPIGAQVSALPDKAQSIVINGVQYYELNGVYYLPVTKDDGTIVYEIVGKDGELNTTDQTVQDQPQGPLMGDIVTQLPPDCRKIKVNGAKLWVSPDGVYYQELVDPSGNRTYKVVGLPSDEPEQN